jgi:hypothetical protein
MTNRLLEIGAGAYPAIQNPGWLFDQEPIDYFAIDANGVSRIKKPNWGIFADGYRHEIYDTACLGRMNKLPFRNETFRRVIMKSVIGEFSIGLLDDSDPYRAEGMNGQTFADTIGGFKDVLRILEPGGHLVVSEEDTPADCLQLGSHLSQAGFSDIEITPYSQHFRMEFRRYYPNYSRVESEDKFTTATAQWRDLRGGYWALESKGSCVQEVSVNDVAEAFYQSSYILTATKPME